MNQIGDLFALIKAFALYGQIWNAGATQRAFVNPNARERAEQDCDVAVSGYAGILPASFPDSRRDACVSSKRFDSFDHLRGVTFAHVKTIALFFLRTFRFVVRFFCRRQNAHQKFDQWRLVLRESLGNARFMFDVAKLR